MGLHNERSFEKQREFVLSEYPGQCKQRTVVAEDGKMRRRELVDGRGVCWLLDYNTPDDFAVTNLCCWHVREPDESLAAELGHSLDEFISWQRAYLHSRLDHPTEFFIITKGDPELINGQLNVSAVYEDDRGIQWRLLFIADPTEFDANGLPKDSQHLADWKVIPSDCNL